MSATGLTRAMTTAFILAWVATCAAYVLDLPELLSLGLISFLALAIVRSLGLALVVPDGRAKGLALVVAAMLAFCYVVALVP